MHIPFETKKISFGIHKGKLFKEIPDDYLKFLLSKGKAHGKLLYHCQIRFNLPKDTYQVKVTDSVGTDGTYIVEAYNKQNAKNQCIKQYNIQCTQSYHGTEFDIKLIKLTL